MSRGLGVAGCYEVGGGWWGLKRMEKSLVTPRSCMVTPKRASAAAMVRLLWVTMRNCRVDGLRILEKVLLMKTTLELPDDLMQRVTSLAEETDQDVGEILADLILKGFATDTPSPRHGWPEPFTLKCGPLTTEDIEAAIAWGRDD